MKNHFDFSGYPGHSEVLNNPNPNFSNAGSYAPETALPGGLPSYLENWYRGYSEDASIKEPNPTSPEPKVVRGFNFLQNQKTKTVLRSTLQVVTVAILIIIAGAIGGFIFLDRKINLEETQASLNRMSETLASESGKGNSISTVQAAALTETAQEEGGAIVPQIAAKTDSRVFNTSGNNNVTANSLPLSIDSDQDGLSDEIEEKLATNPFQKDTDGDGYPDGVEVKNGYDPLTPAVKKNPAVSFAPTPSASGAAPAVASASTTSASCAAGSVDAGASGGKCALDQGGQTDFSNLTGNDYSALQKLGLSEEDIAKAQSGNVDVSGKLEMQKKILSSDSMQSSMQDMFNAIPVSAPAEISDSELKIFDTSKAEDIQKYFQDVNGIFEKNFSGLQSIDAATLKNQIAQNDYTVINQTYNALKNIDAELLKIAVPRDTKEIHKIFLTIIRIYEEVTDENSLRSSDTGQADAIIGKLKSFDSLEVLMQKNLDELSKKYSADNKE
ncbi:MAG: hypothetical protein PHW01_01780 [Patescibacteria group bacterium]|nr:hypothetical protein [Patescibacteria group bacterium]